MISITTSTPFIGFVDSRKGGRVENQDTCGYADTSFGLLVVVCDGMGGGPGGKLASSLAVDTIIRVVRDTTVTVEPEEVLKNAIQIANQVLIKRIVDNPSLRGMGTTVAALLINDYAAILAHAGDSRIYKFRGSRKVYRTTDHSVVSELVRKGTLTEEQARLSAQSNVITRALGVSPEVEVDITELAYEKGDRFMLCTDGIWGNITEKELIKIAAGTKSPGGAVESLVIRVDEQGFAAGGVHDNLTVALIETTSNSILKEKMSKRARIIIAALSAVCLVSIVGNILLLTRNQKPVVVQQSSNVDSLNIDSLLEAKVKPERERMEKQQQKNFERLYELIKNNQIDDANRFLEEKKACQQVVEQLDSVIMQLENLKKMVKGKEKEQGVEKTLSTLKTLAPQLKNYGISDKDLTCQNRNRDNILDLMTHNITKAAPDDKSIGHYNAIISVLNSVRLKIINK